MSKAEAKGMNGAQSWCRHQSACHISRFFLLRLPAALGKDDRLIASISSGAIGPRANPSPVRWAGGWSPSFLRRPKHCQGPGSHGSLAMTISLMTKSKSPSVDQSIPRARPPCPVLAPCLLPTIGSFRTHAIICLEERETESRRARISFLPHPLTLSAPS